MIRVHAKTTRHQRGWTSAAMIAALAGTAVIFVLQSGGKGKESVAVPECGGCQLPPGAERGSVSGSDGIQREWCLTQQVYEANRKANPIYTPVAICPTLGPPDDPSVRDAAIPDENTPIRTYRIYFNVFCEAGGVNPAATAAQVVSAVASLNANYAPSRIQFVYGWRFVSDAKYRFLDDNEVGMMKMKYAVSPATQLNVFVTKYNPGGSWGTFPWDANALTKYGGIVLDQPHFTNPPTVLTHEVGHCVGLWHTFHGVSEVTQCSACYEAAGRSAADGDTKGDLCSDTNPSPRNFNCADPPGTDPCSGNAWLDTPIHNFMSYSLQCATEFTPQQAGRMHAWTAQSLTSWLELPPPPGAPGTPSLSTSGGIVTISWADNSTDETVFEVQRETKNRNKWINPTTVATVGANVTSTTNVPGTGTFRYRVRSGNAVGYSAWSGWAQITN